MLSGTVVVLVGRLGTELLHLFINVARVLSIGTTAPSCRQLGPQLVLAHTVVGAAGVIDVHLYALHVYATRSG